VPDEEVDVVKEMVQSVMESVVTLKVPLKVDVGTGSNWLEAK
jgi:DNA polymerase-1